MSGGTAILCLVIIFLTMTMALYTYDPGSGKASFLVQSNDILTENEDITPLQLRFAFFVLDPEIIHPYSICLQFNIRRLVKNICYCKGFFLIAAGVRG